MNLESGNTLALIHKPSKSISGKMHTSLLRNAHLSLGVSGPNVVFLRRLHCTHPSNLDFKRLICFLSGRLIYMVVMLIYMVVSCVPAQLRLPYVEYSTGELDIT